AKRDLLNAGKISEKPSSATTNVNYDNADFGPVRSASFGTSSSTQAQAGATFWGLMEMSGNVAEMCYSVDAGSNFNTSNVYTSHGNGEIADAVTAWATTPTSFIAKGGDFTSFQNAELMISDRTRANVSDVRDSTMGFRAVHTFGGNVTLDAGTISVPSTGCANGVILSETKPASVKWNGVSIDTRIAYVWYVQKGSAAWELIPDAVSETLTYVQESFSGVSLALKFKRKAITALGEAETAVASTTVPNLTISFSPTSSILKSCDVNLITASVPYTSGTSTYSWITETGTKTGASYTPVYGDFFDGNLTNGNKTVECNVEMSGCRNKANLTVTVTAVETESPINFTCGNNFTDSRNSQIYPTKEIGTQCWMTKNMNIGTIVSYTDYTTHQVEGIQKICYSNNESNCITYGGIYNWDEAVNGENVGTGGANVITAKNKKCAVDGSGYTQGICPDGWHIPSDGEFKTLEMYLGMTQVQADANEWRGTDQGRQLKSTSSLWASGAGTNSSGWSGLPGGYRSYSGGTFDYVGAYGHWWSSSEYTTTFGAAWIRHLSTGGATVLRVSGTNSYGYSVRCLKN
ncbi:MAG: SUMF1/EgtB/PvdO family nonheme iron enzyme, partial [Culturomica sp.]|nr:SUMF1/EgtB/PvdO family nonheme iron enzyme [Culturomica sp.]